MEKYLEMYPEIDKIEELTKSKQIKWKKRKSSFVAKRKATQYDCELRLIFELNPTRLSFRMGANTYKSTRPEVLQRLAALLGGE